MCVKANIAPCDQMPPMSPGVRSWDVDLKSCNLNHFLQEFLSHHTASFKGAGKNLFVNLTPPKLSGCTESPSSMVTYQLAVSGVNEEGRKESRGAVA